MGVTNTMAKIQKVYSAFEDYLAGTLIVSGLLLIFIGVFWRYFLNTPLTWIDEISGYLVVWGALIGSAVALREGQHIQVDFIYDRVSPKWQRVFNIISNVLGILFCLFFLFYGSKLLQLYFKTMQQSTETGINLWLVFLVIPISSLMLGLRFVERFFHSMKGVVD
jgi:C4-dicarboxylate transporter DctQ subunit